MATQNLLAINGAPYDSFLDGLYGGGQYGVSKAGSIGIDNQGNVYSRKGVSDADRRLLQLKYKKEHDPKNKNIYEVEERRLRRQYPNSIVSADKPLSEYMILDNPYQTISQINPTSKLPASYIKPKPGSSTNNKAVKAAATTVKGTVPSTTVINPLQTDLTGVGYRVLVDSKVIPASEMKNVLKTVANDGSKNIQHQLYKVDTNERLFEIHEHGVNTKAGKIPQKHINVDTPKNATSTQKSVAKALNHQKIPTPAYEAFHDFGKVTKVAKNGGKALAVVGVALDAYDLGSTIYDDLNDEDKKLGKKTVSTAVGIGGSWAGAFGGAKLGAMGGAAIGSLICLGPGTVIGGFLGGVIGGIAGGWAGRTAGEAIVENVYQGD